MFAWPVRVSIARLCIHSSFLSQSSQISGKIGQPILYTTLAFASLLSKSRVSRGLKFLWDLILIWKSQEFKSHFISQLEIFNEGHSVHSWQSCREEIRVRGKHQKRAISLGPLRKLRFCAQRPLKKIRRWKIRDPTKSGRGIIPPFLLPLVRPESWNPFPLPSFFRLHTERDFGVVEFIFGVSSLFPLGFVGD